MSNYRDPQDRREDFQRDQLRERLRHADATRQENYRRQDERDRQRRQDEAQKESARGAERTRQQNFSREQYDLRRTDKLEDDNAKLAVGAEEQREVTRREVLLKEIGARLYKLQLDDDHQHDIRTRNLDIQEYEKHSEIDTRRTVTIDNNSAGNSRREIRERLRGVLVEKLTDHYLNEHRKRTAASQELERMEDESDHLTTETREKSAAKVREIWAQNEANKDFELFMFNLNKQRENDTSEELQDILNAMNDLG